MTAAFVWRKKEESKTDSLALSSLKIFNIDVSE